MRTFMQMLRPFFLIVLLLTTDISYAGIGGECPEIIITWDVSELELCDWGTVGTAASREDGPGKIRVATDTFLDVWVHLRFLSTNDTSCCTCIGNVPPGAHVYIEAPVCVWKAPTVTVEIKNGSGTSVEEEITQGSYTKKTNALVHISLDE